MQVGTLLFHQVGERNARDEIGVAAAVVVAVCRVERLVDVADEVHEHAHGLRAILQRSPRVAQRVHALLDAGDDVRRRGDRRGLAGFRPRDGDVVQASPRVSLPERAHVIHPAAGGDEVVGLALIKLVVEQGDEFAHFRARLGGRLLPCDLPDEHVPGTIPRVRSSRHQRRREECREPRAHSTSLSWLNFTTSIWSAPLNSPSLPVARVFLPIHLLSASIWKDSGAFFTKNTSPTPSL